MTLGRPTAQQLNVVSSLTPKSDEAKKLVAEVKAAAPPSGTHLLVGGADAELVDSDDSIGGRLPLALGLIAVITFLLLFLFTGSVVQPLRALALNMVSLGATLGVMTWIFQDGHLSGRIVSAEAFLLAVSFFAFGTAEISFLQLFGLGSGLAILIDALAVRGILLLAAMRLLAGSA